MVKTLGGDRNWRHLQDKYFQKLDILASNSQHITEFKYHDDVLIVWNQIVLHDNDNISGISINRYLIQFHIIMFVDKFC